MENKVFDVTEYLDAPKILRFVNYILDVIIVYIFIILLAVALIFLAAIAGNEAVILWMQNVDDLVGTIIFLVFYIFYYWITETLFSRSIAKFATGTIVVRADGSRPDSIDILRRSFCRLIPFDGLSFLLSSPGGFHDRISDTYVVRKKELEEDMNEFISTLEAQPATVTESISNQHEI
jgi:uncharacterized RDD family membrane protein YckC